MRLVIAQINMHVGDIDGNTDRILEAVTDACQNHQAELVVFPELALSGYPPEDLLLRPSLNARVESALSRIAQAIQVPVVLGYPAMRHGRRLNVAGVISPGMKLPLVEYAKQSLPNYRVFDEKRYFHAGSAAGVFRHGDLDFGLTVCEDIWEPGPAAMARAAGAEVLININASPFRRDKHEDRLAQVQVRARETGLPIVYVNLVGGQDELIFDGGSFVVDASGEICVQAPMFREAMVEVGIARESRQLVVSGATVALPGAAARIYDALVLAVRDYVNKNGFKGVLLGLSGGIDSALVLAIAVDALGADRVQAIMLPYHYTSQISLDGAAVQAAALGVTYRVLSIVPMVDAFMETLAPVFQGFPADTTEENLQSRVRGTLLMAMSNKLGYLVLTTGNKSEMAVGYATLYGDMAGGFDVLKDVSKTWVYHLARYRNGIAEQEVIPGAVIDRPPSAELAPGQVDQDTLPPYDELDDILERYVEQDCSAEAVIRAGFDRDMVYRVVRLVDRNEYKRRQAAVGPRVSRRAFGKDRRYPITNGWRPGD